MEKLTENQAKWLTEQIISTIPISIDGNVNASQSNEMNRIMRIIHQCTDKDFPLLEIKNKQNSLVEIKLSTRNEKLIQLGISFKGVNGTIVCADLNNDEFKQFADGCQKIIQWLEEQE